MNRPTQADANGPKSRVVQITVIGLVVVWLSAYWIRQSEIVSIACQSSGAVPSVPALAMLLLVLVVNPLLRRSRTIRPVSIGEAVLLYCMVSIGVMMYGVGGMRHLMAAMTEHVYLSTPAEPTARLAEFIPSWLAPNSAETIRGMYEGSPRGTVPWDQWHVPVLAWTLFFLLLGGTILGLLVALAGRWLDEERLTFPLARMPLELLGAGTIGPFFRSPLAWVGIGIATLLNITSMTRGVFFGGPSYGGARSVAEQPEPRLPLGRSQPHPIGRPVFQADPRRAWVPGVERCIHFDYLLLSSDEGDYARHRGVWESGPGGPLRPGAIDGWLPGACAESYLGKATRATRSRRGGEVRRQCRP